MPHADDHQPDHPEFVPIPALLRGARGSYGEAVRRDLAAAGFDDLPRNGAYVLAAIIDGRGGDVGDLIRTLRVSKQAASQLIDTMVLRGYLERSVHPDDRRRMQIELTERGQAAAEAIGAAADAIDEELAAMISPRQLAGMRAGLAALTTIRERHAVAD